jgi:hypothetical protein
VYKQKRRLRTAACTAAVGVTMGCVRTLASFVLLAVVIAGPAQEAGQAATAPAEPAATTRSLNRWSVSLSLVNQ